MQHSALTQRCPGKSHGLTRRCPVESSKMLKYISRLFKSFGHVIEIKQFSLENLDTLPQSDWRYLTKFNPVICFFGFCFTLLFPISLNYPFSFVPSGLLCVRPLVLLTSGVNCKQGKKKEIRQLK